MPARPIAISAVHGCSNALHAIVEAVQPEAAATQVSVHANYAASVRLDSQPDYLLFWEHLHFHVPPPHTNGKIAIVGHTAQKSGEVLDLGHVVCIDTFCHGGGWLTGMDVGSGQMW